MIPFLIVLWTLSTASCEWGLYGFPQICLISFELNKAFTDLLLNSEPLSVPIDLIDLLFP